MQSYHLDSDQSIILTSSQMLHRRRLQLLSKVQKMNFEQQPVNPMMEMHSRRDSKAEGVGEHTVSVFGNEVRANARRGAARQTLQLLGRRNNSKTAIQKQNVPAESSGRMGGSVKDIVKTQQCGICPSTSVKVLDLLTGREVLVYRPNTSEEQHTREKNTLQASWRESLQQRYSVQPRKSVQQKESEQQRNSLHQRESKYPFLQTKKFDQDSHLLFEDTSEWQGQRRGADGKISITQALIAYSKVYRNPKAEKVRIKKGRNRMSKAVSLSARSVVMQSKQFRLADHHRYYLKPRLPRLRVKEQQYVVNGWEYTEEPENVSKGQ